MRVAFFCEGFTKHSFVAQPWRHVYELAKRIKSLQNPVCIFSDGLTASPKSDEIDGIPIRRAKKGRWFFDAESLLQNFDEFDADLVDWHGGLLSAVHFLRLQNRLEHQLVWTVDKGKLSFQDISNLRVSDISKLHEFRTNFLYSLTPSFIVKKGANTPGVRQIIAQSKRLKAYFEDIGINQEKITLVPSGVDTSFFHPLSCSDALHHKVSLGFKRNDKIILFFGPLTYWRGADTLISAMPKILGRIPSAKLLLLARQSHLESTHKVSESSVIKSPFIRLERGVVQRILIMRYLGIADVVVLPFRFWPHTECPLTILEGMSMAKPVVTTFAGSIPEIVKNGENGILVSPGNPESLSSAITNLLKNDDISDEIGRRARKCVEENYDWDLITRLTLKVFKKLLG